MLKLFWLNVIPRGADKLTGIQAARFANTAFHHPINGLRGDGLGGYGICGDQKSAQLHDRATMARNYHRLTLQIAIDQFRQVALGIGHGVFAHDWSISV